MFERTDPSQPPPSRRRHARIACLGSCFARIGDGWEGTVVDLSLGGMFLRVKRALNPGSSYFVKLYLGGRVAVVEARVVRLVGGSEEWFAGMEFAQVPLTDRGLLESFIGSYPPPRRGAALRS